MVCLLFKNIIFNMHHINYIQCSSHDDCKLLFNLQYLVNTQSIYIHKYSAHKMPIWVFKVKFERPCIWYISNPRPYWNAFWYNNSWLGFLKILNNVPKEREFFLKQKMSPYLSQLNVVIAHRNYFRRNNLQILKLATYTKIEYHYSGCKLVTF